MARSCGVENTTATCRVMAPAKSTGSTGGPPTAIEAVRSFGVDGGEIWDETERRFVRTGVRVGKGGAIEVLEFLRSCGYAGWPGLVSRSMPRVLVGRGVSSEMPLRFMGVVGRAVGGFEEVLSRPMPSIIEGGWLCSSSYSVSSGGGESTASVGGGVEG
jgi:hypothetical protein